MERGTPLKVRYDAEHDIVCVTGPEATPRARAVSGLEDVAELAQSTAEHHPYWGLLYHSSEVAGAVLDRWDGTISDEQANDIRWSLREMKSALDHMTHG